MAMHSTLLSLVTESDFVSKFLLLSLLMMSILCWSITLYLIIMLQTKLQSIKYTQSKLTNIQSLDELLFKANNLHSSYAGNILSHYLMDFKNFLKSKTRNNKTEKEKYDSEEKWEDLQDSLNQTFDSVMQEEESSVPILSTIAQAAPLIGLLGTIWGLIHAFIGIAQQSSADIAAVAPGIAEALITTLAGLLVAIPALIMFNYVQNKLRSFEQKLLNFTNSCFLIMKSIDINKTFQENRVEQL